MIVIINKRFNLKIAEHSGYQTGSSYLHKVEFGSWGSAGRQISTVHPPQQHHTALPGDRDSTAPATSSLCKQLTDSTDPAHTAPRALAASAHQLWTWKELGTRAQEPPPTCQGKYCHLEAQRVTRRSLCSEIPALPPDKAFQDQ